MRKTSRYPFRLLTTERTGLVSSWEISHPNVIRPASTGRMRLYSSHSPGRERGGTSSFWSSKSTSRSSAVTMAAPLGAEKWAITTVSAMMMAHVSRDCHVKIVVPKSRTPVIFSSSGGSESAVACSCAAEDIPRAHTAPSPMKAAAPSAR